MNKKRLMWAKSLVKAINTSCFILNLNFITLFKNCMIYFCSASTDHCQSLNNNKTVLIKLYCYPESSNSLSLLASWLLDSKLIATFCLSILAKRGHWLSTSNPMLVVMTSFFNKLTAHVRSSKFLSLFLLSALDVLFIYVPLSILMRFCNPECV